ncbi:MAG: AraC family ligand binding domain-containing protein [Planctomycetes bacterium]|nr:AraC family ligand binding domain-containing protein [Planctomycetota bacterium]
MDQDDAGTPDPGPRTPDRGNDAPILPWAGAVRWRQVPRAPGSGLGPEVRPAFAWMGAIDVAEAYDYPEHRHAAYELIGVRRGAYDCLIDGRTVRLQEGGVLIVPPGSRHADRLRPPVAYVGLSFTLDGPPLVAAGRTAAAQCDARMLAILDGLEVEARTGDRCSGRLQDALMKLNAAMFIGSS